MTPKMLGSGLGVIAMTMTLIWALGAGMEATQAVMRALLALGVMFFIGLILGRAMVDTVAPSAPPDQDVSEDGKKDKLQKKGP